MIQVYKTLTKEVEGSDDIEIFHNIEPTMQENRSKIYNFLKEKIREKDHVLLCLNERRCLMPPTTYFGHATLEPLLGEIFWRYFTTIELLKHSANCRKQNKTEGELFKEKFMQFVKEYLDQSMSETPTLVADQDNLERCLNVLNDLELEYKVMN